MKQKISEDLVNIIGSISTVSKVSLRDISYGYILLTIERSRGNKVRAANVLGMSYRNLDRKLACLTSSSISDTQVLSS